MSAYMLGSLSNRDYDDYLKQHMNRLDHRADSFRTMLARGDDAVLCDDPYCREYRRSSSSTSVRQTRRPPRRRTASVSTTNPRHERPRKVPSREDFYGTREDEDWYYYRRPRPRSFGDDGHYDNSISDNDSNSVDDEEDDQLMRARELEAQANAKRNVLVLLDEPVNNNEAELRPVESTPELVAQQPPEQPEEVAPQQTSPAQNDQQQQQQQQQQPNSNTTTPTISTTSSTSTPPKKKKKWPFSLFARRDQSPVGPSTPSPANSASPLGTLHAVRSNGPLGDVLDAQQQDELVRQLYSKDTRGTLQQEQQRPQLQQPHQSPYQQQNNMALVANLDHIWVFRATNSIDTHNIWTTFDYPNQERIKQHKQMLDRYGLRHDEGVELFDSHIRQGQLPILVLPNRKEGYYPLNLSGDEIVRVQVDCIPKSSVSRFVVRQHQHTSNFLA